MSLSRRVLFLAPTLLFVSSACHEHAPPPAPTPPPPLEQPDAGAAPDAGSAPPSSDTLSHTFTRLNGGSPRPAWFICDGTNVPRIAVVERDAQGTSATFTWLDKGSGTPSRPETLKLGPADPGAGQVHYALSRGDQEVGYVHAINPEMVSDPGRAWIPPVVSLQLDGNPLTCRWVLGTRVVGFDGRRSVLVTQEGQALSYTTFDFADAPKARPAHAEGYGSTTSASLQLKGGVEARAADGSTFTFHNGAYTYVLRTGADASLEVQHEGSSVQRTALLAWTVATPP